MIGLVRVAGQVRPVLVMAAALGLAGCETTGTGSVAGGACRAFLRPAYVVLGRTSYDQDWIDQTVETGVGACAWPRPSPRPAELERAALPIAAKPAAAAAAGRAGWIKRARGKILSVAGKAAPAPSLPATAPASFPANQVAPIEPTPAPPVVASQPAPMLPPRSKLDQLLHPDRK